MGKMGKKEHGAYAPNLNTESHGRRITPFETSLDYTKTGAHLQLSQVVPESSTPMSWILVPKPCP